MLQQLISALFTSPLDGAANLLMRTHKLDDSLTFPLSSFPDPIHRPRNDLVFGRRSLKQFPTCIRTVRIPQNPRRLNSFSDILPRLSTPPYHAKL